MLIKILKSFYKFNAAIATWTHWLAMAMVCAMFIIVTYDVVLRYFFNNPTIWVMELSGYAMALSVTLAAAFTLKEGGHVIVDVVVMRLSKKTRAIMDIVGLLLSEIYVVIFSYQAIMMALKARQYNWHEQTVLGSPLFPYQLIFSLGGFILALMVIAEIGKRIVILSENQVPESK